MYVCGGSKLFLLFPCVSGLAVGVIAGICLAAVGLIVLSVWFYLRCKKNKSMKQASPSEKPGYQLAHSSNSLYPS